MLGAVVNPQGLSPQKRKGAPNPVRPACFLSSGFLLVFIEDALADCFLVNPVQLGTRWPHGSRAIVGEVENGQGDAAKKVF